MPAHKIQHSFQNGIEGKICSQCGQWKPLTEFYTRSALSDGLRSDCKECSKSKRKRYYQDNREQELSRRKQYIEEHKEELRSYQKLYNEGHKEEKKEYNKKYRETHYEELLAYQRNYNEVHKDKKRKYYDLHKEERAEYNRQWKKANPDKVRAQVLNRLALKANAEGKITEETIRQIYKKFNYSCAYCGADLSDGTGHIDHIVPLSKNGSNLIDNLALACQHCNCSKGVKDVDIWCKEQGFSNPFG